MIPVPPRTLIARLVLIALLLLPLALSPPPARAACTISGTAFRDYNFSGARDVPGEVVLPGIIVEVYAAGSAVPIATATTDANGTYTINLAVTGQVRVEYIIPFTYLEPSPFGADSPTTVTFVECDGNVTLNFGANNIGSYCHEQENGILLVTSCFALGPSNDPLISPEPAIVSFPYEAGAVGLMRPNADYDQVPPGTAKAMVATIGEVGSIWGQAYHRTTDSYFLAPFVKRHVGLGPGGINTLYIIRNVSDPLLATSAPFVNLETLFPDLATTNVDPRGGVATFDDYLTDRLAFDAVGRIGWGDIDISDDDRTLFAVNLGDRRVYIIPVGDGLTGGPTLGTVTRSAIPNPCATDPDDMRPFATAFNDGLLYVGVVCSAESTQNRADLSAHVYSMEPNGTFSAAPVFSMPLNYPRRCVNDFASDGEPCAGRPTVAVDLPGGGSYTPLSTNSSGIWLPWLRTGDPSGFPFAGGGVERDVSYPQPLLSDIEFDGQDMILGFRDRFPDQHGDNRARTPNWGITEDQLFNSRGGGDILRACWVGNGWELEANGVCGGIQGGGPDSAHGPGAVFPGPIDIPIPNFAAIQPNRFGFGEYYSGDTFPFFGAPTVVAGYASHSEVAIGGLAQVPGYPDVVVSVYDPIPVEAILSADFFDAFFDSGVRWLRNRDATVPPATAVGEIARAFRIVNGDALGPPVPGDTAGKANGLGDMEALCGPAPLEIGNRVWEDLDRNGIQDPGERVFEGVIVSLYLIRGGGETFIAQTTTNADGEYYFNATTIDAYRAANGLPLNVPGVTFFDINNDGVWNPNEPRGIMPDTRYSIRLDDPANYTGAPSLPLEEYFATVPNAPGGGADSRRDSDGIVPDFDTRVSVANVPVINLRTGYFGANNHTYDFGFALEQVQITPTPPEPTPPGDTPVPTIPPVTELPATGESPLAGWRWVVFGLIGLVSALVLVLVLITGRKPGERG